MSPVRTAYILLWFPKPSETFVFREVANLRRLGLPIMVFTNYGPLTRDLSPEMRQYPGFVERLGLRRLGAFLPDIQYWRRRNPRAFKETVRALYTTPWRGLEKTGENFWAFLCAFTLARRFEEERIELIHAPWANGPATTAWLASKLTGIPFGFTARAWDIYPPDGALSAKIRDSLFVRTNTRANVEHLRPFAGNHFHKILLTYNGVTIKDPDPAKVAMRPPFRLLAMGRFARSKGFEYLLRACHILKSQGVPVTLTLAGDGLLGILLKKMVRDLGLSGSVEFPGFVSHDQVSGLMRQSDVFVMPSVVAASGDRDGIPNVILEALMHRLPVVASDVSGIGEVIRHGETGRLVPQRDAGALAGEIRNMVEDRTQALHLAEQGRGLVRRLFNPEVNHRRLFDFYHDCRSRGPEAAPENPRPWGA